jgi:hypothetical protein
MDKIVRGVLLAEAPHAAKPKNKDNITGMSNRSLNNLEMVLFIFPYLNYSTK